MTAGGGSKDFFVSYSGADQAWAEWIAWVLEEAGYAVVLQAWDFRPGSNFVLEMQQAAAQVERTIAVFSPDFLASWFTAPEWAAAFARDPTGALGLLLPVRVRACEPTGLLPQIVYIDLLGLEDKNAARDRLLAGVKRARAKPAVAPAFPGATMPLRRREIPEEPRFPGTKKAEGYKHLAIAGWLFLILSLLCSLPISLAYILGYSNGGGLVIIAFRFSLITSLFAIILFYMHGATQPIGNRIFFYFLLQPWCLSFTY